VDAFVIAVDVLSLEDFFLEEDNAIIKPDATNTADPAMIGM